MFTTVKDPYFKQLIIKMQLFIGIAFSTFAWVQRATLCKHHTAPFCRLRWLLFCKAELHFSLLSWNRRADGKSPSKDPFVTVTLDLPQSRI